eukprot:SM000026S08903  [mRNA]  locus=s26:349398:351459:- [translate_table: standard]
MPLTRQSSSLRTPASGLKLAVARPNPDAVLSKGGPAGEAEAFAAGPCESPSPLNNLVGLADLEAIRVIGKGSGITQLVQHRWTNDLYALKTLPFGIPEARRESMTAELDANHGAACPYLAICYRAVLVGSQTSIIWEYADRGSVADIAHACRQLPELYLATLAKQVLAGILYLHNHSIVHGNVKPANILVNHKGEVKLTDYGLRPFLDPLAGQPATFGGLASYMPPEAIKGSLPAPGDDIWALGVSLLELALGRHPFVPASALTAPVGPPAELADASSTAPVAAPDASLPAVLKAIVNMEVPSTGVADYSEDFSSFVSWWCVT